MLFLSPLFLLFGLAAGVPLVLHLYQRRNRTVMLYSTNRFFTQSILRSQRRLRLRRLILLLLRMAACLCIALAAAQPILDLFGLARRAGSRDVVILLDDSLSMSGPGAAGGPTGRGHAGASKFVEARDMALDLVHHLVSGDRAALITYTGRVYGGGRPSQPALSKDLAGLASEVASLTPTQAAGDPTSALALAARLFDNSPQRTRAVIVLSDMQDSDWRKQPLVQPDLPVDVLCVPVGTPPTAACVLDDLELGQGSAVVGQPNVLTVHAVNYGPALVRPRLTVQLDGKEISSQPLTVPAFSPAVAHVPVIFATPGDHRIVAGFTGHKAARPGGDSSSLRSGIGSPRSEIFLAARAIADLPLLLVDGQADADTANATLRRQAPGFFLRAALLASGATGEQAQSLRPDVVPASDLARTQLSTYRVVILCNVRDLPASQVERLENFVARGGGLAIFMGDQADLDFYNRLIGSAARPLGGLMPATFSGPVGFEQVGPADQALHILTVDEHQPALQRFAGALRSSLATISIYRCYKITPRATAPGDCWVLAAMDRGLPLLVEHAYGKGRVLLMGTAPTPAWTNLPLRRVFIPLLSRLTMYLAGGGTPNLPVEVGQPVDLVHGGWDTSKPLWVTAPDGGRLTASIRIEGAAAVAYLPGRAVAQPGFYTVQLKGMNVRSDGRLDGGPGRRPGELLAANVPPSEALPGVVKLSSLQALAGRWRLHEVDLPRRGPMPSLTSILAAQTSGRGIWDTLLWLALAAVLIETLVANQIRSLRRHREDDRQWETQAA